MNKNIGLNKVGILSILFSIAILSCNKDVDNPVPNDRPVYPTGIRVASILNAPNYSLLKAAVERAATSSASPSIASLLSDSSLTFTLFAPNDAAFIASGINATAISFLSPLTLDSVLRYHIVSQAVPASSLVNAPFPNLQYPSLFNPATQLSSLFRLTTFLKASPNGAWINNIPILKVDSLFSNGIVHQVARIVMPPSKNLWETINTDPDLTYLKAAVERADSGVVEKDKLQTALGNIGLNATVFAPTNSAFKALLIDAIKIYLESQGQDATDAQNDATGLVEAVGTTLLTNPGSIPVYGSVLRTLISPLNIQGIVAYHVLSAQSGTYRPPGIRVFSVNLPTAETKVKTLLNAATPFALHPGVTVSASFATGLPIVAAATVKGAATITGIGDPLPANIIISTTPSVFTHDLHHTNGVIHKIDKVLLPRKLL